MNELEIKKKELSWHRHPLTVILVSFVFGGIVLHYVETNTAKSQLLHEKRVSIMHEITRFSAEVNTVIRRTNGLSKVRNNQRYSQNEINVIQLKLQDSIDKAYETAAILCLELAVYFPRTEAYEQFLQVRNMIIHRVEKAIDDLKNHEKTEKVFTQADHDNLTVEINKVLHIVVKSIDFKGIEKQKVFYEKEE